MSSRFSVALDLGDFSPRLAGSKLGERHQVQLDVDGAVWVYATHAELGILIGQLTDLAAEMVRADATEAS